MMPKNVWDPEEELDDPNSPYNTMLRDAAKRGRPRADQPPQEWQGSPWDQQTPPDAPADPGALQQMATGLSGLRDTISGWMDAPGRRSAIAQMGAVLSQPTPAGQNFFGHLGQALGQGAEAQQRAIKSEADLEREQALTDFYAARSDAAGTTADAKMLGAESRARSVRGQKIMLDPSTGRYRLAAPGPEMPQPRPDNFPQTVANKRSTAEWLQKAPRFWNEVKAALSSTDPTIRRAAEESVRRAQANLTDPDALVQWLNQGE